jgi:SAM-dependent methyltransferase
MAVTREDESAGAVEPFDDAALYDFEYRRRRDDVHFYRTLAVEQGGPVLDLACGTGRLMVPMLRDGLTVVGVDQAPAMLASAAAKIARLPPAARARALLVRADLRRFAFQGFTRRRAAAASAGPEPRFTFAVAAFHSVQHLIADRDLTAFLRAARRALDPRGWLAFDVFVPHPRFLERDEKRRWDRTQFRDPTTGQRLVYTVNHHLDRRRRVLLMRMYYQPVDEHGRATGPERVRRLCHRQLGRGEVRALLERAGLRLVAAWSDFAGTAMSLDGDGADGGDGASGHDDGDASEQHIYLAQPR